ncbi:ABC-2 type transport system ATP-binding protein/bacitracin transport system ATP-binding protein [Tumebacillus sp. BK434]|uniref:ABC transporter ATP-binding protein n=1 Tax=Tumebacillus sp. BK434 TaxID=2512169 RepID=UPI001053FD04|nr:ABC transporter ATP-binding protein [Tumebacillus sp. BK434]TCP53938.1 ABC-2 type transport system ATP-binding protein/bacitracin transport system ATP-binding protein [Tumebacillus sp. BK434]
MQPLLEIKQLSKSYGGKAVVQNLDMTIYPGDIYGFLGPNGAGKTTTIRMILGLIQKSGGEILFAGQKMELLDDPFAQIGCLVEAPGLYPNLTGRQNLVLFQKLRKQRNNARIEELLEMVDLQHAADQKVKSYSLGMKQRLAIAIALLPNPRLLVLDEPTNGLDPAGIREMRAFLKKLAGHGMTILISSHLLDEIEKVATRLCIIHGGKQVLEAPLDRLLQAHNDLEIASAEPQAVFSFVTNWLKARGHESATRLTDGKVLIEGFPDDSAALNAAMVQSGLPISELRVQRSRLEDMFMTITEGGHAHVGRVAGRSV